jgi:hypothetical protein
MKKMPKVAIISKHLEVVWVYTFNTLLNNLLFYYDDNVFTFLFSTQIIRITEE